MHLSPETLSKAQLYITRIMGTRRVPIILSRLWSAFWGRENVDTAGLMASPIGFAHKPDDRCHETSSDLLTDRKNRHCGEFS